MSGERGDVDTTTIGDWKKKDPALCEWYRLKDIFNMDELQDYFFVQRPMKGFHTKVEDCAGGKQSKERITPTLTASMMGEKPKPLVIGNQGGLSSIRALIRTLSKQIKQYKKWYAPL